MRSTPWAVLYPGPSPFFTWLFTFRGLSNPTPNLSHLDPRPHLHTPPRIPAPCRTFTSPLVAHVPKPGALQPSTGLGLSEAALGGEGSLSALAAGTLWQQRWRWHLTAPVAYGFREQLLQAH